MLNHYLDDRRRTLCKNHGQVYNLAKDHSPFLDRLNLMKNLPVHEGCVNTICWNKTGEYLLSGSDDGNLCITKPDYLFDKTSDYTVLHKVQTHHLGNIFSAQFIPNSSDSLLVSCSSGGPVIVHDIHSDTPSQGVYSYNCHSSIVFEVAVVPEDDNVFLSCGKDKTVRLYDLRCHKSCARAGTCPHPALIRNSHAVTTLSMHPLNSNLLLVGRADGVGLVYDRRKLPDVSKFSREKAHQAYLEAQSRVDDDSNGGADDSHQMEDSLTSGKIFSYMHPLDGVVAQFAVPDMEEKCSFTSLCYSANGQQVLASYSQDYVYLFNVDKSSNFELIKALPKRNQPNESATSQDSPPRPSTRRTPRIRVRGDWSDTGIYSAPRSLRTGEGDASRGPAQSNPNYIQRMTELAYSFGARRDGGSRFLPVTEIIAGPIDYTGSSDTNNQTDQSERTNEANNLNDNDEDEDEVEDTTDEDDESSEDEDMITLEHINVEPSTLRQPQSQTPNQEGGKSRVSLDTKLKFQNLRDNLRNKYAHIPTYRPRVCYQGHRNSRTLIKEAVFWGDNYVISGSDCGRIMMWEKDTAKLVMSFPADNRVVNCLAPNPHHYALASSGIDYDIKLWSVADGCPLKISQSEMDEIVMNNELMLEEAKQTITVPPHLFFRVLASFAHQRSQP